MNSKELKKVVLAIFDDAVLDDIELPRESLETFVSSVFKNYQARTRTTTSGTR